MPPLYPQRKIAQRIPGLQTVPGPGDTIVDQFGNTYRQVDSGEASILRQGTGNTVYILYPDGTIG